MTISSLLLDPQYAALKEYVVKHTGLSYYVDKDEDFATRLSRRFAARSIHHCGAYLRLLLDPRSGGDEMDRFVGELTIGETYFFRERMAFTALAEQILPPLIRARRGTEQRLRLWRSAPWPPDRAMQL